MFIYCENSLFNLDNYSLIRPLQYEEEGEQKSQILFLKPNSQKDALSLHNFHYALQIVNEIKEALKRGKKFLDISLLVEASNREKLAEMQAKEEKEEKEEDGKPNE